MNDRNRKKLCFCMLLLVLLMALHAMTASAATVSLNRKKLSMMPGLTFQLTLKNAASGKIKWYSSDKKIARVSKTGLVTARSTGSCRVRAVYKGQTFSCKVNVKQVSSSKKKILKSTTKKGYTNRILLAGSSTFSRWSSAATAFSPYKIINNGISGSTVVEWLQYYKQLIVPYKPAAIVLYMGTNDLDNGGLISGSTNASNTMRLIRRIRKALPDVPIFYASIVPCYGRSGAWKAVKTSNKKMRAYCKKTEGVFYLDMASATTGRNGKPNQALFGSDRIHPNSAGYAVWKLTVADAVTDYLKDHLVKPQDTGATDEEALLAQDEEDVIWVDEADMLVKILGGD